VGAKEAGRFQVALVGGLLAMLLVYVLLGVRAVKPSNLSPFVSEGVTSVLACASFVFISYGGITKVAALAEETRNPGRNLPLGMILSLFVGWMLYASVILVTVGVLESEGLKTTLTPISDGAHVLGGRILEICISVGALLAFISTANAGVLTASRYPLGMSRDKLIPDSFRRVGRRSGTPYIAILFTGSCMILSIVFLRIELLVKVASTVMILLYVLANLTLVLFRESKIASYRPKFRSPFYPYPQVIGILGGIFLLIEMGTYIVFLTIVFLLVGFGWYRLYARARARQDSALIHMVERLVAADKALASDGLLTELKDIVMERDGVIRDRFHQLVEKAGVLDDDRPLRMEDFFRTAADLLAQRLDLDAVDLYEKFVERENTASTVVADGLAIPHVVIEDARDLDLILVRARAGIIFPGDKVIHTAFVLVGSSGDRVCHLHILAAIAQITQNPDFSAKWLDATDIDDLRNLVLLAERTRSSARKSRDPFE
jgi:mannitol/fructose-specific phosphotransferase system IIA component (Ntr-type)